MNKENPFKTPKGYFDNFAANFMAQIPEEQPVTTERKRPLMTVVMRRVMYAACLMALCFGGYLVWSQHIEAEKQDASIAEYNKVHDQYVDDYLDCAMLDNGDIYACMSE